VSYMKLGEFPEAVRVLIQKLPDNDRNRLLYPHADATKGRQIQEIIIEVLEESIKDGESEERMLERLTEYAATNWP